jgi:hypothetical protein
MAFYKICGIQSSSGGLCCRFGFYRNITSVFGQVVFLLKRHEISNAIYVSYILLGCKLKHIILPIVVISKNDSFKVKHFNVKSY